MAKQNGQFIGAGEDVSDVLPLSVTADEGLVESSLSDWGQFANEKNAVFKLYREKQGGGLALCCEFSPTDYTPDTIESMILQEFGGGKYRVQARSGGKLRMNQLIEVESAKNSFMPRHLEAAQLGRERDDNMLLAMLNMQQQASERMLLMMQSNAQNQMQLLQVILPLLVGNKQEIDPIAIQSGVFSQLSAMRDLFGSQKSGGLGEIKEAIALVQQLTGDGGNAESNAFGALASLANNFGPVFLKAMEANAARGAQTPAPTTPRAPAPALQAPAAPVPQDALTTMINNLVMMCDRGMTAEQTVDAIITAEEAGQLPTESVDDLFNYASDETLIPRLSQLFPQVAQRAAWFEALRLELVEASKEPPEETDLTSNAGDGALSPTVTAPSPVENASPNQDGENS